MTKHLKAKQTKLWSDKKKQITSLPYDIEMKLLKLAKSAGYSYVHEILPFINGFQSCLNCSPEIFNGLRDAIKKEQQDHWERGLELLHDMSCQAPPDDFINITDKLPEKGKDIIGIDDQDREQYCFRCACHNPNCKEWRCSITGNGLIINILRWKYFNK